MSSAVISTSAEQGRFFVFDAECAPEVSPRSFENQKLTEVLRASAARLPQSTITNQKSKILSSVTPASAWLCAPRHKWFPAASARSILLPEACRAVA